GRLAEPFARVDLAAAREQSLHRLDISGAGSQHEDGFPAFQRRVRVCASLQQQGHNCRVAVRTCRRQPRYAIAIYRVRIGARSHEQFNSLSIIVICSPVQRGGSVDLGGVYVDGRPEEFADGGLVSLLSSIGECGARRRGGWGRQAGPEQYESTYFS